jgi:hypothetical protein
MGCIEQSVREMKTVTIIGLTIGPFDKFSVGYRWSRGLRHALTAVVMVPASTLLALLTSGCLIVERAPSHSSWPKPFAAKDLRQFEGVYRNH